MIIIERIIKYKKIIWYYFNIIDVYDKLYDEILFYVENKTVDVDGVEFNVINFDKLDVKENYLHNEFVMVDYVEEDKIDEFLKYKNYNHREDSLISFNVPIFMNNNLQSYKNDSFNIWNQFDLDCPRSPIYVNNKKINSDTELRIELKNFQKYFVKSECNMFNLVTIIAMLCNQSSYAFPYIFFNKVENNTNSNVVATNCTDNRSINIETHDNGIKIWIKTDVLFRNVKKNIIDAKANIKLLIEAPNVHTDELYNVFNKYGLFFINFY